MKIVFWGTPKFCIPIFDSILNSKHKIICVVTQPDKKRGRGKSISYSPIKEKAIENNIPYFTPDSIKNDKNIHNKLINLDSDIFIVVAFGQILPKDVLEIPNKGCWNIHASLLPKWRGAAPIQWSLINGDKETGVGVMQMEEGLDTGPILIEKTIKIEIIDNAETLSKKLSETSSQLIIEALDIIEDQKINLIAQNKLKRETNYARLLKKEDFKIDWNLSGKEIYQKIKGLYPNTYTILKDKRIKILEAIPYDKKFTKITDINLHKIIFINKEDKKDNGEIIGYIKHLGILVQTSDIPLLITRIKYQGKNEADKNTLLQQIINEKNGSIFA